VVKIGLLFICNVCERMIIKLCRQTKAQNREKDGYPFGFFNF
jgi:hypothetical protein